MDADREKEMNLSRREIRVLLLDEFFLGHKATEATNNICTTIGQDIISTHAAQCWFYRFNSGNYELDDSSRSGRPVEVDLDRLKHLIEDDLRLTTFNSTTWMLSYYGGNMFERIRKDVELWGLDTS